MNNPEIMTLIEELEEASAELARADVTSAIIVGYADVEAVIDASSRFVDAESRLVEAILGALSTAYTEGAREGWNDGYEDGRSGAPKLSPYGSRPWVVNDEK